MPIASRFHTNHVRTFASQISRAPESIRAIQLGAAEQLLLEIEEDALYPFDYIVYRITEYRGENVNQPMLLGSALLSDLVSLIAIVSRTLDLPAHGMLTAEQVAAELGVSTRTINRLRHEGLVFHWVLEKSGRRRIGCAIPTLNEFRKRNSGRIQKASQFSRLTSTQKQEIVTLAMQFEGKKQTLSEVAAEISKHSTRGHETIRLLLKQTDSTSTTFSQPKALSRKDARDIEQELRNGTTWDELTFRYQRTVGAMRKSLARLRATRLKQLDISYVELEVFLREDAEEIILGAPSAQDVLPPLLMLESLEFGQGNTGLEGEETAIVSAMHLLRRRASKQSKAMKYSPPEKILDRIETDLRWSFSLQQKLVIESMPSSLAVAVQHVGRPLHELPLNQLISLVNHVINVVGETCGTLDPSKGQSAARTPASILDRNLHLTDKQVKPLRASAKYKTIELKHPFHQIVPWSYLLARRNVPLLAQETSSELEQLVAMRFGWCGRPRTINEIANQLNKSNIWVSRQLRSWI